MQFILLDNYNDVIAFFEAYGVSTGAITRNSYKIRKKELQAFSQNLPYDLNSELQKQNNILYRCETLKEILLRKIRVSKRDGGKRNGYRCILIDATITIEEDKERYIFILETYTHQQKDDISRSERENYIQILINFEKKLLEEGIIR